jgi:hypothetical protein
MMSNFGAAGKPWVTGMFTATANFKKMLEYCLFDVFKERKLVPFTGIAGMPKHTSSVGAIKPFSSDWMVPRTRPRARYETFPWCKQFCAALDVLGKELAITSNNLALFSASLCRNMLCLSHTEY